MTLADAISISDQQHFVLTGVSWKFYEQLLEEIGSRQLRVTFDNGNLEMMAPLQTHEEWKSIIGRLIERMTEELHVDIRTLGSTTFKRKDLEKGLEPDECYYIHNYDRVYRKSKLDFTVDPPPDLAVEIDITRRSIARQPVYAALGIPELWRFDGSRLHVLHLKKGKYVELESSRSFPFLPMSVFESFVVRMNSERPSSVLPEFVAWVRTLKVG